MVLVSIGLNLAMQPALAERDMRVQNHEGSLSCYYLDAFLGLVPYERIVPSMPFAGATKCSWANGRELHFLSSDWLFGWKRCSSFRASDWLPGF
jgi:hypothetical protein